MRTLLTFILLFYCYCTSVHAETWRFTSVKANADLITKNSERTVAWCNEYYQTDDCIKTVVTEPTAQDMAFEEQKMMLQIRISDLATKITNAIADDDDALVNSLRAQRNALKTQLNALEN